MSGLSVGNRLSSVGTGLTSGSSGLSTGSELQGGQLAYNFLAAVLPGGAALTRASSGTRFNSSGVLVTESSDVARFTYDPGTLALQGLLVEPSRTNLALQSNVLGTGWTLDHITINTGVAGPDGVVNSLKKMAEDNTTNNHRFFRGFTVVSGSIYTLSIVAAPAERTALQLGDASTPAVSADFNLSTGVAGNVGAGVISTASVQLPNGQWWFSIIYTTASTTATVVASLLKAGSTNYLGTTGEGAYAGFVQLELGTGRSTYIDTTTTAVTRSQDVLTLAAPNGTYAATIERLSGTTQLTGQAVSAGTFTVPTDVSPLRRVTLQRTA